MKIVDISGKKFGRLTAIRQNGKIGKSIAWLCVCDCGNNVTKPGTALRFGHVTSCGCYKSEIISAGANTKHGMKHTATYRVWCGMKDRCHNPASPAYESYGARGIYLCDRWRESFLAFFEDMGEKPLNMSLDRIDNDGPYSPENCRWTSPREQSNNTRRNVRISFDGKEMTISEWARKTGMSVDLLKHRLARGWSLEKAMTTPVDIKKRNKMTKS